MKVNDCDSHRGMLFHIHVPLFVFSVFIGNFSDLCHKSHFGLVTTMNISASISGVSKMSSLLATARPHAIVILCAGNKISALDSGG